MQKLVEVVRRLVLFVAPFAMTPRDGR